MYYKLYNAPKDRLKEALSLTRKKYHKEFYATKGINLEVKKQARHATSRNSGTPVALIRSPTQRMGDALNALRP